MIIGVNIALHGVTRSYIDIHPGQSRMEAGRN